MVPALAVAACVLLPTWIWSALVLDQPRLEGGVLAFAVAGAAACALIAHRRLIAPPGTVFFVAALTLGAVALRSVPEGQAIGGLADRAPLLAAWALVGLAAAARARRGVVLTAIVGGIAAAAWLGVVQALGWDPPGFEPWGRVRPVYPFAGQNHAVEVLVPALLVGVVCGPRPRARPLAWLAMIAPIAWMTGFAGALAGYLALGLGAAWTLLRFRDRAPALAVALVLVVGGDLSRTALGGATALPSGGVPQSTSVRLELYGAVAERVAATPLGIGLGRFELDYPRWRDPEEAAIAAADPELVAHRIPKTPHDEPLLAALELGWAGVVLLAVALVRALRARSGDGRTTPALAALAVFALVRSPWSDNPPALALSAVLLGLELRPPPLGRAWAGTVAMAAAVTLACLPAAAQIRGEWHLRRFQHPAFNRLEDLAQATAARPWDYRAWELRGLVHLGLEQWAHARACFEHALHRNPTSLAALTGMMQIEMVSPRGDQRAALRWLDRAEEVAPDHPAVRDARRRWLTAIRDVHQAMADEHLAAGRPAAGVHLASVELTSARLALLEGDVDAARRHLFQAAPFVGVHRAQVERVARMEELDRALVARLTERVFPGWPEDLTLGS